MKMAKGLLLGSAAGLVAVAGAQAADLPVKAKPIQYVKICTLYGVGFYYIPGTDMCLKIGGYVRAESAYHVNGSSVTVASADVNNRLTCDLWWRIRGYITADARNQTEYGTVRSYIAVGLSTNTVGFDNTSNQFDANRAFIQWAGFTFGRAQSFFDFFSYAAINYLGFVSGSDTGDGGKEVFAYTAQLGNGWSASLSAETRRMTQIVGQGCFNPSTSVTLCSLGNPNLVTLGFPGVSVAPNVGTINGANTAFATAGIGGNGYGGWDVPDIVANLRVDQAWGSAQVAGALHEVNAAYFNTTAGGGVPFNNVFPNLEPSGRPDNAWGWALMGGLKINTPFIGPGDYLQLGAIYTQGALRYLFQNPNTNFWFQNGSNVAFGITSDGVYGGRLTPLGGGGATNSVITATNIQLTTAWGIQASYEHFWTPAWRTSLYGGYNQISYNNQANNILCVLEGDSFVTSGGTNIGNRPGSLAAGAVGCENNWKWWFIGSRTQWNVTKDFYLGVDVAYLRVDGMDTSTGFITGGGAVPTTTNQGTTITHATAGACPVGVNCGLFKVLDQENNWMVRFRAHRDFYP